MKTPSSRRIRPSQFLFASLLVFAWSAAGEGIALTRDEQLNRLEREQGELAVAQAKTLRDRAVVELERTEEMFASRIVTINELKKARQAREEAEIAFQQAQINLNRTRLKFLTDATLITIEDAKKYRKPDGKYWVELTFVNSSDVAKAKSAMEGVKDMGTRELGALLNISNVLVMLTDDKKMILARPYQNIIPSLGLGAKITLKYELLRRDVESLTVNLEFMGVQRTLPVFLRLDSSQDLPTISSMQYAQEGQLGTLVHYDLELERLAPSEKKFQLAVINMPPEIPVAFVDSKSKARVTDVKFTEEVSKQVMELEVTLPQKLEQRFVNSRIVFYAIVSDSSEIPKLERLKQEAPNGKINPEQLATLAGHVVEMTLKPVGTGRLEVTMSNLFKQVQPGERALLKLLIVNTGTIAVRNVAIVVDPPLQWEAELDPKILDVVDPGQSKAVTLTAISPLGTAIGDYALRISSKGYAGSEIVESSEKDITLRVAGTGSTWGIWIIAAATMTVILVLAVACIKIARR